MLVVKLCQPNDKAKWCSKSQNMLLLPFPVPHGPDLHFQLYFYPSMMPNPQRFPIGILQIWRWMHEELFLLDRFSVFVQLLNIIPNKAMRNVSQFTCWLWRFFGVFLVFFLLVVRAVWPLFLFISPLLSTNRENQNFSEKVSDKRKASGISLRAH